MKALRITIPVRTAVAFIAVAMLASSALAQSRGNARLNGKVVDEQGQPVADVVVKAQMNGQTEVFSATSDKKGEFRINGLANGEWKVELAKPDLETATEMVEVRGDKAPALNVTLKKASKDPTAEINAELQRAATIAQSGKIPEARKIYEDLLVKYPSVYQIEGFIARTYAAETPPNIPKALEHLKINLDKEPANVELKLFQAELLMESGDKAGSKAILDTVDMTQVKDPYTYINHAINLINDKKGMEAADLLTRLINQFPTANELYYYRGRAYVAAEKLDLARTDLEKFVTLAPTAKEVADAKKILEQLKK
jgi:tetratricopeptide (TPR) repeat protein